MAPAGPRLGRWPCGRPVCLPYTRKAPSQQSGLLVSLGGHSREGTCRPVTSEPGGFACVADSARPLGRGPTCRVHCPPRALVCPQEVTRSTCKDPVDLLSSFPGGAQRLSLPSALHAGPGHGDVGHRPSVMAGAAAAAAGPSPGLRPCLLSCSPWEEAFCCRKWFHSLKASLPWS